MSRLAAVTLPVILVFASACDEEVGCGSLGCGAQTGLSFELDPGCSEAEMAGELELVAGKGDGKGGFLALEPDEVPELHSGPQGGLHMWTGLQIRNPDLERPLHRISFRFQFCEADLDCALDESWIYGGLEGMSVPVDDRSIWTPVDGSYLRETDQGWLEIRDVLEFLPYDFDNDPTTQVRLVVGAEDSCGRVGQAVYRDPRESAAG